MPGAEGRLSRKDRIWVGVLLAIAVAVTLVAAFPEVIPLRIPRFQLPTRDWTVLREGRCTGIALLQVHSNYQNLPKEVGQPRGFSRIGGDPATFFFTIPAGYDQATTQVTFGMSPKPNEPRAFLVTHQGDETPLDIQQGFENLRAACVQIPRRYPPDVPHMDVKVVLPGGDMSVWRINKLPKTEEAFPAKGDIREEQRLSPAIVVEGLAWSEERAPGSTFPMLATALHARGVTGAGWEWRELQRASPFIAPGETLSTSGVVGSALDPQTATFGNAESHEYAHLIPLVRATGKLVRFVQLEETLDFGTIRVRRRPDVPTGNPHGEFLLDLRAPIARTTPRGLRVTLKPFEGPKNSYYSLGAPVLHLHLELDDATLRHGLPANWQKENVQRLVEAVVVASGRDSSFREIHNTHRPPGLGRRTPTGAINQTIPRLKAGPFHLRLRVRRRIALEAYPFELRLPVVPRLNPHTRHGMTGQASVSFEPDWKALRSLTSAARGAPTPRSAGSGATR